MNRLLGSLPDHERQGLERASRRIELPAGHVISRTGERPDWLYFPTGAIVSLASCLPGHPAAQVATIGREGVVGVEHLLGWTGLPFETSVQVAGGFVCLPVAALDSDVLRGALLRYAQALFVQVGQLSACARLHPIDRRLVRWLLSTHDRLGDRLPVTQVFIARALGVRRASVNAVALMLQRAGFITYSRGVVRIRDRAGLESAACPCYRIVREANDRALGAA